MSSRVSNGTTEDVAFMGMPDRLAETFAGKRILITGGTGFLGKVIIELLLRRSVSLDKLILLVRSKKGKDPQQRIEEMLRGPLYSKLLSRRDMKELMSKIIAVNGDVSAPDLGLSETDRTICLTANIIIHSAATVRFDEGLKSAVILNTRGTKLMLDLAKQCPKLDLFIYVSTAYSHPDVKVLEEIAYPPPADPYEILNLMEKSDASTIDVMTTKLLGIYPNTYAYSKALAEDLAYTAMETLPLIILRPSVVIPVYQEPLPGWTDNVNGPVGLMIGAGKGVIRTMYADDRTFADFIPVDVVANCVLLASWEYLVNGHKHKIINVITSDEVKYTWKEILDTGRVIVTTKVPLDNILWYPGGSMTRFKWYHKLRALLFHWIPAIFVDILLFCLGYKPVLLRVHRRIAKGMEVVEFYANNQWYFKSTVIQESRKLMTPTERLVYKLDIEGLDKFKYLEDCAISARRNLLKEKDENMPRAMKVLHIMKYMDIISKTMIYGYLLHFFVNKLVIYKDALF